MRRAVALVGRTAAAWRRLRGMGDLRGRGPAADRPRSPAGVDGSGRAKLLLALCAACWCAVTSAQMPHTASKAPAAAKATLVPEATCAACHADEHRAWSGSQHARAMQPATAQTVIADFQDRRLVQGDRRWRFFREGARFVVETDGPGGAIGRFDVVYTFGLAPLQQYLARTPGGRLQALPWAWDVQRARWFHLLPSEQALDHRHPLHWTALPHNANTNCAECHTTGYRKAYDAATDRYDTRWHQPNVGCQSCHGPASAHLAWARAPKPGSEPDGGGRRGFSTDLHQASPPLQTETCARCHALREPLGDPAPAGPRLMDAYLPALLTPGLYFVDGQQQDEVFIYGSWLQSRMHAAGLRCSDCHDAHSGRPRAADNTLCTRCHQAAGPAGAAAGPHVSTSGLKARDYDHPSHHGHAPGTAGSRCVDCHAPGRTYMGIDPRRDHAFGIPRPDLGAALKVPDACTGCHADRGPAWAAEVLAQRRGGPPPPHPAASAALAMDAGRRAGPGAVTGLLALVDDPTRPAIVRATALELLRGYPGATLMQRQVQALGDADPMVRRVGASAMAGLAPPLRWRVLAPLLDDPVRAVRMEAARLLAGLSREAAAASDAERAALSRAVAEFSDGLRQHAEKPTALLAQGNLHRDRGELDAAEAAWQAALRRDERFVPALVNLADLRRQRGRDRDAEALLSQALERQPGEPRLLEALVLTRVRLGQHAAALASLRAAPVRAQAPERQGPRLGHLEALLLDAAGRRLEALAVLQATHRQHPADREVLLQLVAWHRDAGQATQAQALMAALRAINPWDPALAGR